MGIRILVVEDDEFLRQLLVDVLSKAGYETESVADGASATQLIGLKPCDIVISDIRMPKLDGIQLLHWCKRNAPATKVILTTGFSNVMDIREAHELGAADFIAKPFQKADLLGGISRLLPKQAKAAGTSDPDLPPEGVASQDSDFCRLSLDDFVAGKTIPFCIYIRLSETKYVKIAHTGEEIDLERLKSYRSKNVAHFYLTKEDFKKYLQMSLLISKNLGNVPEISAEKKLWFLKHTSEVLQEYVHVAGVNEEAFRTAKNFVGAVVENIAHRSDLVTLLEMLNEHTDFLYAHSLGTALYATMICQQLGWTSSPTTNTAMLCGLFHDVGMKEIDSDLLKMPRIMLNQKQRSAIETHCARGGEILGSVQGIPQEIAQVAFQHHENCLGHGYPNFLKKTEISPLAQLVSVADIFCEYAIKNPDSPKGMAAEAALQQIYQFKLEGLNLNFLEALRTAALGLSS